MNTPLRDKVFLYNEQTRSMPSADLLTFFLERHPGRIAFSTSLGAEDQVILHMLSCIALPVRIFTLDTGRLFQETYDLLSISRQKYGIPIDICFPDAGAVEEMVNGKGINLFYDSVENRQQCCRIRKIDPSKRVLQEMEVWITGIRRDQLVTRESAEAIEWDEGLSLIKVNPLIEWTNQEVWDFIRTHHVPYNTLHDQGYPSIGCLPCTRPVNAGDSPRSGRWWWENPALKECGLHIKTTNTMNP